MSTTDSSHEKGSTCLAKRFGHFDRLKVSCVELPPSKKFFRMHFGFAFDLGRALCASVRLRDGM